MRSRGRFASWKWVPVRTGADAYVNAGNSRFSGAAQGGNSWVAGGVPLFRDPR
jgi:hypothetical protein